MPRQRGPTTSRSTNVEALWRMAETRRPPKAGPVGAEQPVRGTRPPWARVVVAAGRRCSTCLDRPAAAGAGGGAADPRRRRRQWPRAIQAVSGAEAAGEVAQRRLPRWRRRPRRKVAGILAEGGVVGQPAWTMWWSASASTSRPAVAAARTSRRRATSIEGELGRPRRIAAPSSAESLRGGCGGGYRELVAQGGEPRSWLDAWRARRGRHAAAARVEWGRWRTGRGAGWRSDVDASGALLVETEPAAWRA